MSDLSVFSFHFRGFLRKYDREGNILWTKADFVDQVKILFCLIQSISILRLFGDFLTLVFISNKAMSSLYKSNVVFVS
jgi:hypothetical protein